MAEKNQDGGLAHNNKIVHCCRFPPQPLGALAVRQYLEKLQPHAGLSEATDMKG